MMTIYKVVIVKQDSKGKDRIEQVQTFDKRCDADNFIQSLQAKPRPYKTRKNELYYEMSGI